MTIGSGNLAGYKSRIATPSFGFSLEVPVGDAITIGPYIGFKKIIRRNDDWAYNRNVSTSAWFGARGSYYFDELIGFDEDFDFYAGAALGFNYWRQRQTSNVGLEDISSAQLSFPNLGLHIGGRYWLREGIAIYGETGLGIGGQQLNPWLNLGATFKL